jgi:hypothetical protein
LHEFERKQAGRAGIAAEGGGRRNLRVGGIPGRGAFIILCLDWAVAASVSEWMSLHSLTLAATSEMKKAENG